MNWREMNCPLGWLMSAIIVGYVATFIYCVATGQTPPGTPCIRWEFC